MANVFPSSGIQDLLIYGGIFLLGIFIKSKIQWGKTNTDVLETLTKDYAALKELYNSKCDDLKRKQEDFRQATELLAEARARTSAYENFLQTRTFETDALLKKVPPVLEAVAAHLNIVIPEKGMDGHEAAHSQVKSDA